MAVDNNNKYSAGVYRFLKDNGMEGLPDYDTFLGEMQNSEQRKFVYDQIAKRTKGQMTFDKFSERMGMPNFSGSENAFSINGKPRVAENPYPTSQVEQPTDVSNSVDTRDLVQQKLQEARNSGTQAVNDSLPKAQVDTTNVQTPDTTNVQSADTTSVNANVQPQVQTSNANSVTSTPERQMPQYMTDEALNSGNANMQKIQQNQQMAEAQAEADRQRKYALEDNKKVLDEQKNEWYDEDIALDKKRQELEAKYPQGWQPTNKLAIDQYNKDIEEYNNQLNLHKSNGNAINDNAVVLQNEEASLSKSFPNLHKELFPNDNKATNQSVEDFVKTTLDDVNNSIEEENEEERARRNEYIKNGGAARMALVGTQQRDRNIENETNKATKRILERMQEQINESYAEKKDEKVTSWLTDKAGIVGKVAGNVFEFDQATKRGAHDEVKHGMGFDYGFLDAREYTNLLNIAKKQEELDAIAEKLSNGKTITKEERAKLDRGLTKAEQNLLDAASMQGVVDEMYKTGFGYTAGKEGVDMIPFMLQIAASPLSGTSGALTKQLAKRYIKKFAGNKVKTRLAAYGTRLLADEAVGIAQALTVGAPATFADYERRKLGNINSGVDEYGNLVLYNGRKDGMSSGKALTSAILSKSLEYSTEDLSERTAGFGKVISGVANSLKNTKGGMLVAKTGEKLGTAVGVDKFMKWAGNLNNESLVKFGNYLKKAGHVGNVFEEDLEEIENNIGNGIIDYVFEGKNDFTTEEGGVFNLHDNIETFLAVTTPQIYLGLLTRGLAVGHRDHRKSADYVRYRQMTSDIDKNAQAMFGNGTWESIKSNIDGAKTTELADVVTNLVTSNDLTPDQKMTVLNYAHASQGAKAEEIAENQLDSYKFETDPLYQDLAKTANATMGIVVTAETKDGEQVYVKSDINNPLDQSWVYNPQSGETYQINTDELTTVGEPLDVNEQAEKIDNAEELAETMQVGDTWVDPNTGLQYTIMEIGQEGLPIAQVYDAINDTTEPRELTPDEVLGWKSATDEQNRKNELNPIDKLKEGQANNDQELANNGAAELIDAIKNADSEESLKGIEEQVKSVGLSDNADIKKSIEDKRNELAEIKKKQEEEEKQKAEEHKNVIRNLSNNIKSAKTEGEIALIEQQIENMADLTDDERNMFVRKIAEAREDIAKQTQTPATPTAPAIPTTETPVGGQQGGNAPTMEDGGGQIQVGNGGNSGEETPSTPAKEDLINKAGKAITDKWNVALKVVGNKASQTISGKKMKGHYVMTEADSISPSHNPLDSFKKTEGFPEDKNGKTINDRDYENDKNEQNGVISIANNYTGEALTNMPIVSHDAGIPYSGNKRTQASILAAQNGTDKEYIESLKDNLQNYGFDEEDLARFTHPRITFVLDEDLPYDTETFALFNKPAEYAQGKAALMVKMGKVLDSGLFNVMMDAIGSHETIGEVWQDATAVNSLISALQNGGILSQAEYARFVDNNELTEEGKELIVNALVGKVLEGKEDAVKALTDPETKQLAQSVISALPQIAANKSLEDDYSLINDIADAIILAHDARKNGVSGSQPITTHLRQQDIAFDGEEQQMPSATVIALGTFIHSNKTSYLRDFLKKYNDYCRENGSAQTSLFEDISIEDRIKLWLADSVADIANDIKTSNNGKTITGATKQILSTLEWLENLLRNNNENKPSENGEGTEQSKQSKPETTESGANAEPVGGSKAGGKTESTGSNEGSNDGNGNGEHGAEVTDKPKTKNQGSANTIFTESRKNAARERLLGRHKKRLGINIDPNDLIDLVEIGGYYIESGVRKFADFAQQMVNDFADAFDVRPYLQQVYMALKHDADIKKLNIDKKEWSTEDEVDDFDVNSLQAQTEEGEENNDNNNEENNGNEEGGNVQESGGNNISGTETGGNGESTVGTNGESGRGNSGSNSGTGEGTAVSGGNSGTEEGASVGSSGVSSEGGKKGSGGVRRTGGNNRGRKSSTNGTRGTGRGNRGSSTSESESGSTGELSDEEKAKQAEDKAYEDAKTEYAKQTDIKALKALREELKKSLKEEEDYLKKAEIQGKYRAIVERIKELLKEQPKAAVDISQEKVPYIPASDPEGNHAIGSVVPSGAMGYLNDAIARLEEKEKKSVDEYVREELGYKTLDDMYSDYANGKQTGLASEQVDSVGLAIEAMKENRCFIVGDMTGVGKGRQAASLIRWGVKNKKKVIFITEKSDLFTAMYNDLVDIDSGNLTPFIVNNDSNANITEEVEDDTEEEDDEIDDEFLDEDEDQPKKKKKRKKKSNAKVIIRKPSKAVKDALYATDSDELPSIGKKGDKKYDFVMMTYSQANKYDPKKHDAKLDWLKNYAKDAIIVMDESHNASGDSKSGAYFRDVVEKCQGVTFLSATYAKRPENMMLYAMRSSMKDINMTKEDLLNAIGEYGIPMQEILAGALFQSGEMVRRERDFSDVKTHWMKPDELYTEKEIESFKHTSDATSALLNEMIDFQRSTVGDIVDNLNQGYKADNDAARLVHGPIKRAMYNPYSGQVSNIFNIMMYGMKARKTAEMAIQQIKEGKKPTIAVENTLEAYIKRLPDGEIDSADFANVFERGLKNLTKYKTVTYIWDEEAGKYKKDEDSEVLFDATTDDNISTTYLEQKIKEYKDDSERAKLSLSPIDQIKEMIAEAGYKCGEITGRGNALISTKDGKFRKETISNDKKSTMAQFNNGSLDAVILNVAGATGISLHSSKRFKDQKPRTMLILQPARNVSTEVQMRGRIDRTGQVHRGEYFYITSPIPAEQKLIMMLKQKLASLDANSVGTENVSSNKVDSQDMDNKYGDEVARQFLLENLTNINNQLDNGLSYNKKLRMWEGHEGLLYDVFIGIQRMTCEEQQYVINELSQRFAEQMAFLDQNGVNDLKTSTMNLDATTIDEAVFVKGRDNNSSNYFAHDTNIERVESNVLKKPLRSADILKKMKQLGVFGEDDKIDDNYATDKIYSRMIEACDQIIADFEAGQKTKLEKFKAAFPSKYKWNVSGLTQEEINQKIESSPAYKEFVQKQADELSKKRSDVGDLRSTAYNALMYLKPGMPYFVPLTDNVGNDAPMMYGRFIGFETGDYKPRNIKALFAVKDSRSQISIPIVSQKDAIKKIISDSQYELTFQELLSDDPNKSYWERRELTSDEKLKNVDEWWDKMIPKGETNRQIRYMITGNVLQACGAIGKYKGQIVSYTHRDKETGETTIEKGMLLAEDFDPENFRIKKQIKKEDVWSNYSEHKDTDHNISVHRQGDRFMVVKFNKRDREKLSDHPINKDEELKKLFYTFEPYRDHIEAYVEEKNVEEVLQQLYDKYSFTTEELFVMPDSTEKPDAIVRTNRPYQEVIDEFSNKYGCSYEGDTRRTLNKMLKQYKMDVNNEDLKNRIKEVSQLYQAYLRKKYTNEESVHLAWQVIIYDQRIKEALADDDKDERERSMRIREAILEELEFRKFGGHEMHLKQGEWDKKEFVDTFNKLNSNKENAERFKKIWDIVKKLKTNIVLNEKIKNSIGGQAAGKVVEYNWEYMNAKYISDQAKADTILHELTHTVTAYAIHAIKYSMDHLLTPNMKEDVGYLTTILNAIKKNPAFVHRSADGIYEDYGITNTAELLSEISSNENFRDDLKKVNLLLATRFGVPTFYEDNGKPMEGATKISAYDAVLEILNRMIDGFDEHAWEEFYKGTAYGEYSYQQMESAGKNMGLSDKQISEALNPKSIVIKPNETLSHFIERVNNAFKAGQTLLKAHLDASKQVIQQKGIKDANIIGSIADDLFEKIGANVRMWFETQESARLKRNGAQFQIGYHGSGANFDKFDHSFIGTGEGNQAYGYGTYISDVKGTGIHYANVAASNNTPYEAKYIGNAKYSQSVIDEAQDIAQMQGSNFENLQYYAKSMLEQLEGEDEETIAPYKLIAESKESDWKTSLEGKRHLYEVEIPEDNGNNYLDWNSKLEDSVLEKVRAGLSVYDTYKLDELLTRLQDEDRTPRNAELYADLVEVLGSDKAASEFLNKVGFVGMRVRTNNLNNTGDHSANNYVIFNENDAKIVNHTQFQIQDGDMHLDDGTVYGWAEENGIHLTLEGLRPETEIHEYGHLWMASMKVNNPALYESLMRLMKGTAAWDKVVNDPNYANLTTDDAILSEAFCQYSGTKGQKTLVDTMREAIANGMTLEDKVARSVEYSRLAKKLDRAWEWTTKSLLGVDPTDFKSIDEAADMLLMDILNGRGPIDGGFNGGGYLPDGRIKSSNGRTSDGRVIPTITSEFSLGGSASNPSVVASDSYERATASNATKFEEAWVDHLVSIQNLQNAIVDETGKPLKDFENAYLRAQIAPSINQEMGEKAQRELVQPLINAMNAVIRPIYEVARKTDKKSRKESRGDAMAQLEKYMIAKHGIERNEVLSRRDAVAKSNEEYAEQLANAEKEVDEKTKIYTRVESEYKMGLASKAEYQQATNEMNNALQAYKQVELKRKAREDRLYKENRLNDKAGLTQTFSETGSSEVIVLEKAAEDYVKDFESRVGDKAAIDELWNRINALNKQTLKNLVDSGLISREQYNTFSTQYKNYVSLRGWNDETADDLYSYINSHDGAIQSPIKKAEGRLTRAGDILANMLVMNASSIILGNKNKVKQALLNLAQSHHTSLLGVGNAWYIKTTNGTKTVSIQVVPDIYQINPKTGTCSADTMTPEQIADHLADFEEDMRDKHKQGLVMSNKERLNLGLPITKQEENQHIVKACVNGKEYTIYVNGAPNAAQAINGKLNADANLDAFRTAMKTVKQWMARTYTSYDPTFLVRNIEKDIISATSVGTIKYGAEYGARLAANIDSLMPFLNTGHKNTWQKGMLEGFTTTFTGIYQLQTRYEKGTLDMSNETERLYKEFRENGGRTGYSALWNVEMYNEQIGKAIKKAMSKANGEKAKAIITGANALSEYMNHGFEDLARFATYMTSRQMGHSILISVADAKDASTNFNKKGSGAMFNAWFREFYVFANPAIQGIARYLYLAQGRNIYGTGTTNDTQSDKRKARFFGGLAVGISLGMVMTMLNYMCGGGAGDGDDDDEFSDKNLGNKYWSLSTYKRRNTINIPTPYEGYVTINLTPEEAVPYAIGSILTEHFLGYGHIEQMPYEIISEVSRLNPLGDISINNIKDLDDVKSSLERSVMPSALLPVFEAYDWNEDFMGRQIHGAKFGDSDKRPKYSLTVYDTPKWQKNVAEYIYKNVPFGKDLGWSGNPNVITHLYEGYMGGLVKFPILLFNTAEMLKQDDSTPESDKISPNNTPVKVFWNSVSMGYNKSSAVRNEFKYYKDRIDEVEEFLNAEGIKDRTAKIRYINQHLDEDEDYQYWLDFEKHRTQYNKAKKEARDNADAYLDVQKASLKDWFKTDKSRE